MNIQKRYCLEVGDGKGEGLSAIGDRGKATIHSFLTLMEHVFTFVKVHNLKV